MRGLHKLEAFRLLAERMSELETLRQQRIQNRDDFAVADREIVESSLAAVVTFLQECKIESGALVPLLADLAALSAGASPSPMLAPAATRHRRPDAPLIESIKGRLAAIMEFQQQHAGMTRKAAGEWVVRHIPLKMKSQLGSPTRATMDSWLLKWGGETGPSSNGREGYLPMHTILADRKPAEQALIKVMKSIEKSLQY